MTAEDLAEGKIATRIKNDQFVEYAINPREMGLLLVKYNRALLAKTEKESLANFEKLVKKVVDSFNLDGEGVKSEKDFLNSCLAICDENLSLAFFHGKNDVEKLTNVHKYVCEKINSVEEAKPETIGEARKLEGMDNSLRKESKIYEEHKKAYNFMSGCIRDEGKFESLYKTFNGRIPKEEFRNKIAENFSKKNGIKDSFLQQQSDYFNAFIKFRLMADRRLINPANAQKIEEKVV